MLSLKSHPLRLFQVPNGTLHRHRSLSDRHRRFHADVVRNASSKVPEASEVPDVSFNFVARYQAVFRAMPLYTGGLGIVGILVNRILSGVSEATVWTEQLGNSHACMEKTPILSLHQLLITGLDS